jgi:uncharacterized protein YbjT (DUF2867 family)
MAVPGGALGLVAVTGAGGFVGRRLVKYLRDRGYAVRGIVRSPRAVGWLRETGCQAALADVRDPASLREAFAGVRAVIHLVAILREHGDETFDAVNHTGARNVAAAAREAGVNRFVHLSVVGAHPQATRYLRSKWMGEEAVRASGLSAVVFRASILIGPGGGAAQQFADVVRFGMWYPLVLQFGGRGFFARLASLIPLVPVLGSGAYRSMPVALDDVVPALAASVDRPDVAGQTFEIGGPRVVTYNAIVDTTARALGLRRRRLHLPVWATGAVVRVLSVLPNPPITGDEARALFEDNLCDNTRVIRTFDLRLRSFEDAVREAISTTRAKE